MHYGCVVSGRGAYTYRATVAISPSLRLGNSWGVFNDAGLGTRNVELSSVPLERRGFEHQRPRRTGETWRFSHCRFGFAPANHRMHSQTEVVSPSLAPLATNLLIAS
jgi:hypothetical protein